MRIGEIGKLTASPSTPIIAWSICQTACRYCFEYDIFCAIIFKECCEMQGEATGTEGRPNRHAQK